MNKKLTGFLILFAILAGFVFGFYSKQIFNANSVHLEVSSDGLKNYYTPMYHVKYDSSYFHFSGMNYPFGDHVVMADCQPLISNTIKFISNNIVDISDYTLGILNILMLFSFFLTGWLLWKIMMRFGMDPLYSALAAAGLALLSPQVIRMSGHYALSYSFVFPAVWYLYLKFFDSGKWTHSLCLGLCIFLFAWIHPYYLAISIIFLSGAWLFSWLYQKKEKPFSYFLKHFLLQVVLPVIAFQLIITLTDSVSDRPANPYGITMYRSLLKSIFLPFTLANMGWVRRLPGQEANWEGFSYIGFTGVMVFLFFIFRYGKRIIFPGRRSLSGVEVPSYFKRKFTFKGFSIFKRKLKPSLQLSLAVSVLSGIIVLLLALGFPFTIKENWMVKILPFMRQFRSLGRFAWVFYFTWGVFAFYIVYAWARRFRMKKMKFIYYPLITLPFFFIFTESYLYQIPRQQSFNHTPMAELNDPSNQKPRNIWLQKIDKNKYNAMIMFPFFHVGSENIGIENKDSLSTAFSASLKTGLPLMNCQMSRTSLNQTWMLMQAAGLPYRKLEIAPLIKSNKPILAVRFKKLWNPFNGDALLRGRTPFYSDDEVDLFELTQKNFEEFTNPLSYYAPEQPNSNDMSARFGAPVSISERGLIDDSFEMGIVEINNFDDGDTKGYRGKGMTLDRGKSNYLYRKDPNVNAGDTLIISLWVRMRMDGAGTTLLGLQEEQGINNNKQWVYPNLASHILVMDGEWALVEKEFVMKENESSLVVNIVRWNSSHLMIDVDELMIRKKGYHVWSAPEGAVMIDNKYFPMP